eukprot:2832545-Rhodomonas_salina.1
MYEIVKAFSRRSLVSPWPLNVFVFLFDYFNYWTKRAKVDKLYEWEGQTESSKLDMYLRRNRKVDELANCKTYPATVLLDPARSDDRGVSQTQNYPNQKEDKSYDIKDELQIDSEVCALSGAWCGRLVRWFMVRVRCSSATTVTMPGNERENNATAIAYSASRLQRPSPRS